MKVSIITVSYNSANTIRETIESVRRQSYKNYEYLIIDGGSTDDTLSIIQEYKKKMDIKMVSEKDDGLYDAMNKGIKMASGDIIGILNSDDYFEINTLKLVVDKFKSSNTDIVSGLMRLVTYTGKEIRIQRNDDLSKIKQRMPVNHPATFVKKKTYEKIGYFNIKYSVSADYDFMCRCYVGGEQFSFIDNILSNMRMGGLSGGGDGSAKALKIALQTACDDREIIRKYFGIDDRLSYYQKCIVLYLRIIKRLFFKNRQCR